MTGGRAIELRHGTVRQHFLLHFFSWPGGILPCALSRMVVAISKVQFRLQANSCTAATATRLTSMSRRATSARFWPIVSRRSLISNLRNEPSCKGGALRKLEADFGGCYALSFSTVNRFRSTVHTLALGGRPVCDHKLQAGATTQMASQCFGEKPATAMNRRACQLSGSNLCR